MTNWPLIYLAILLGSPFLVLAAALLHRELRIGWPMPLQVAIIVVVAALTVFSIGGFFGFAVSAAACVCYFFAGQLLASVVLGRRHHDQERLRSITRIRPPTARSVLSSWWPSGGSLILKMLLFLGILHFLTASVRQNSRHPERSFPEIIEDVEPDID